MTAGRLKHVALVLGVMLLTWPAAAIAQGRPPRDPMVIRQQLEQSLQLQQKTRDLLAEQPDEALKKVWEAYVQLRDAHGSMTVNASNAKYPDPLFPLMNKRISDAQAFLVTARDMLRLRNQHENAIERARDALTEAMRLTQIVLATAF